MSEALPLFDAVLHKRRPRWPWTLGGLGAAVVIAGVLFAARTSGTYRVMTAKGFQLVRRGMDARQVQSIFGSGPILHGVGPDGAECLTYGHPTLQRPNFLVYEACYRDGRLSRLTEKELSAQAIDPELLKKQIEP